MVFVWFILIGLVAGFLAGLILKGRGFGILGNIIVGVLGAIIGGFLAGVLGIAATNIIGQILVATGGAIVLLVLISFVKRKP